jgi:CBS domain-containing membrane protein
MTEKSRRVDIEVPDADHPAHARTRQSAGHEQRRRVTLPQILVAWLGAFVGIGLLAIAVDRLPTLNLLVIGSFGASAVLLYGAPRAPFSQPRNLVGGHLISAAVGVACFRYLPDVLALQEAAAVATSIALMMATRTMHPPGGATALIAVVGSEAVHVLGWAYLFPVMIGALLLLLTALVSNNLFEPGSYPERWD